MLICRCGDRVLAVDYRWLAGFWISFLWFPLNVFTPFEVMSVLKYLSSFMFNHGCLRSRILLFFREGDESITTVSIHQRAKKSGKSPAHNEAWLVKTRHECRLMLLCLRRVIRAQQRVKKLNDRQILTVLCHWMWLTDGVFCSRNELYSMCVMCQELIRMLDERANCSQCTFLQSHGSSDLASFSLYFTSLYKPVLLPGCICGIRHCWNWLW